MVAAPAGLVNHIALARPASDVIPFPVMKGDLMANTRKKTTSVQGLSLPDDLVAEVEDLHRRQLQALQKINPDATLSKGRVYAGLIRAGLELEGKPVSRKKGKGGVWGNG
jgi:hypothetical protein